MITVNGQNKLTLYNMILQNGGKHPKISLVTADEFLSVFQYCEIISCRVKLKFQFDSFY